MHFFLFICADDFPERRVSATIGFVVIQIAQTTDKQAFDEDKSNFQMHVVGKSLKDSKTQKTLKPSWFFKSFLIFVAF